jgi:putative endonuclease
VVLVFQQHLERLDEAVAAEHQIKGWRREKKEALIRGDFAALSLLSQRRGTAVRGSRRPPAAPERSSP